jgi:predicted 3-demethylubiquinone-9 3-methyltransferase (glyoxalase superfamily)
MLFNDMAEDTMNFYLSLCSQSGIIEIAKYDASQALLEGKIMKASVSIYGPD